jgi:hypothetical protein
MVSQFLNAGDMKGLSVEEAGNTINGMWIFGVQMKFLLMLN